jgi:hypothetical protein
MKLLFVSFLSLGAVSVISKIIMYIPMIRTTQITIGWKMEKNAAHTDHFNCSRFILNNNPNETGKVLI